MVYGSEKFTYKHIENWAQIPEGWDFEVAGLAVDKEDNVYAFSRTQHPVMIFTREGKFIRSWGEGRFTWPHEIAIDPNGYVWTDDAMDNTIIKHDLNGNELLTLGEKGKFSDSGYVMDGTEIKSNFYKSLDTIKRGAPPFNRPTCMDFTSQGEIFVSDGYGNSRVHKFSADGKMLLSWGEPGRSPGEFRCVHGVTVDEPGGRLLVCDRENNRIQIFDFNGKYITEWKGIPRPTKAVLDKEGNVYIAVLAWRPEMPEVPESLAGVMIYSSEGVLQTRWGSENEELRNLKESMFLAPHSIAIDSRGDIYVSEVRHSKLRRNKMVQKFVRRQQDNN